MTTSLQDFKLVTAAAGFTLGFDILTVEIIIKQTLTVKISQWSVYIYMIWEKILTNLEIDIVEWLFMKGIISLGYFFFFFISSFQEFSHDCLLASFLIDLLKFHFLHRISVLFALLFFWVFEIQLLMQIIINQIFIVAKNRELMIRVKWITAVIITLINIFMFCIWISAHLNLSVSQEYVCWSLLKSIASVTICLTDSLSAMSWSTSTEIECQRFLFAWLMLC